MNQKILITVRQPSSGYTCDARVPTDIRCDFITDAISALFRELSDSEYVPGRQPLLWSETLNDFIDVNKTAAENGLLNGDRWILV